MTLHTIVYLTPFFRNFDFLSAFFLYIWELWMIHRQNLGESERRESGLSHQVLNWRLIRLPSYGLSEFHVRRRIGRSMNRGELRCLLYMFSGATNSEDAT
jgi:hypothetical protein